LHCAACDLEVRKHTSLVKVLRGEKSYGAKRFLKEFPDDFLSFIFEQAAEEDRSNLNSQLKIWP